jgi:hypothetical protein
MKSINTLVILLFISFLSPPSWSESLVRGVFKRDGPDYQKFTNVPSADKAIGQGQVSIKNGVIKREGVWVDYHENGQLFTKSNYKNDKREGAWVGYYENGQLLYKGNYKNDLSEGTWFFYDVDGIAIKEPSGNYEDGEKISD